jgi:hypothetical protein
MGCGASGFDSGVSTADDNDIKIHAKPYPIASDISKFDQLVQLDRIFHRQLFGEGFDEAHDDHLGRRASLKAARHQVEELLFVDLADGRFVLDIRRIVANLILRQRVAPRLIVEDQGIAFDVGVGIFGPGRIRTVPR